MPIIKFRAKAKSESHSKTIVESRGFKIIIDEPKSVGGSNEAANPVEYVLAALAGCLNVVGHMVAKERGMTLNGLGIEIEGDLEIQKFNNTDKESAVYKEIRVKMIPDMVDTEENMRAWLLEVEGRCAVSRTLKVPVDVLIRLK